MMHRSDIDPDLERQLEAASEDEPVEAVLLLRKSGTNDRPLDPQTLMERVGACETDKVEMNYMPRIGALIVRARSAVIRRLIDQPEVEMASANRLEGDEEL
jgi:hypothetical protein